ESEEMFSGRDFEKLLMEKGSWYFDESGQPQLDSQDSIEVMTFITDMVKGGYTLNVSEWTQAWYDCLSQGTVATMPAASWMGGFLSGWIAPDAAGLWRVIPLPAWEEGGNTATNDGGSNLCITEVSENKDAAWAFIEFMLGREDSQMTMYKGSDIFPSLVTTYDDPFFGEEVEYYGNQKVREVFAAITENIPAISYQEFYSQANESLIEAFSKIIYNDVSVEQAMSEANEQVITKTQ
ncbi:MAG: extracellular solute-binding protein, partial [Vallitaleaceae bacterium]|nr:extracellular solute-binding protein [Vallitaleaceae bacterium]